MPLGQLTFEAIRNTLVSDTGLTIAADSSVTTTGTISAGSTVLTVASSTSFTAGHGVRITDAGTGGGKLATWIESIDGLDWTLHDKAVSAVVAKAVEHDDRAVVPADNILPAYGNFPVAFPAIDMRMEGGSGNNFSKSDAGDLWLYVYYQSGPDTRGQPMTVLNLIVWRIRDLLHKPGGGVSNSAVRIQKLWEVYRSGITPEDNISETIHSRALHYEYIVTDA